MIPKILEIFYREFPCHLIFLQEFPVEWFAFREFNNFRIFCKFSPFRIFWSFGWMGYYYYIIMKRQGNKYLLMNLVNSSSHKEDYAKKLKTIWLKVWKIIFSQLLIVNFHSKPLLLRIVKMFRRKSFWPFQFYAPKLIRTNRSEIITTSNLCHEKDCCCSSW